MIDEQRELLSHVLAWHRENGPKVLPCQGMGYPDDVIKKFEMAYATYRIHIPVLYTRSISVSDEMEGGLYIRANTIPLISGCLSGFCKDDLSAIAQEHGVCAEDFIYTFSAALEIHRLDDTNRMTGSEVFRRCFEALELAAHYEVRKIYDNPQNATPFYMMAITTATSPKLWPKTIISEYCSANSAGSEDTDKDKNPKFDARRHVIFDAIKNDDNLPRDDSGPRYDWFLDRAGMLLPAVTNKTLGSFTLWEDLVHQASQPGDTPVHRIMDFCVYNPPLSLRPGILNGLRSMTLRSSETITDGMALLNFLKKKLTGTWLAPVLQSDILKMNLLCLEDPYSRTSKIKFYPDIVGSLGIDREHLAERVFKEILEIAPQEISLAYFDAIGQSRAIKDEQVISQGFDREQFLSHLLKAKTCFLANEQVTSKDLKEIRNIINYRCRQAFAMLGQNHQFDYEKFKDLHSDGVRFLAEQGLDMRKLPKMNLRDRGHLLEDVLGL